MLEKYPPANQDEYVELKSLLNLKFVRDTKYIGETCLLTLCDI